MKKLEVAVKVDLEIFVKIKLEGGNIEDFVIISSSLDEAITYLYARFSENMLKLSTNSEGYLCDQEDATRTRLIKEEKIITIDFKVLKDLDF